jgi:branched-chain amino acid transport system substrate-binding protein
MRTTSKLAFILIAGVYSALASADINVGVVLSTTGPAASLGVPERNTIEFLPKTIGGQKINYIVQNDESLPPKAAEVVKKLIDEKNIDVVIGPTTSPSGGAITPVVALAKVPAIMLAAGLALISPMTPDKRWVFKTPQNDSLMAQALVGDMLARGFSTLAIIAFNDPYGTGWTEQVKEAAKDRIKVMSVTPFRRESTQVNDLVKKLMEGNPDAVLIAGSGTPALLPQIALKRYKYAGQVYQTHGVANTEFLRYGGRNLDKTILPAGPVLVASQLQDSHPSKGDALEYISTYEKKYGTGSTSAFGAHAWDAGKILSAAVPVALAKAQPGTPAFRSALRDAIESAKGVKGAHGVFNLTEQNHNGMDESARVIVTIANGTWKVVAK